MAEDLYSVLARFHRETVLPDIDKRIGGLREEMRGEFGSVREEIGELRREMLSHFDAIYARFDRLESEYHALAAAVARLEARSLTRAEFQHELEQLKSRVKELEQRIADLETQS